MKKILIVTFILVSIFLSISFAAYTLHKTLNKPQLPVLSQVTNFKLVDLHGNQFSLKSLEGKIWIADFFFTTCSDICPIMTKNMRSLYESFKLEPKVRLVSITVNPEQDGPETLKRYASEMKIRENKWHFLTGQRKDIRRLLVNDFKLGDVSEPIFHSSYFALVDGDGLIRGYYDGTDKEAVAQLFKDTAALL